MPRKSPYTILLTESEKSQLEAMARKYTLAYYMVVRAKIVLLAAVQRKVLMPNDFYSLDELADRLLRFQKRYEKIAKPFEWKFTRDDLSRLLSRLASESVTFAKAA